MSSAEIYQFPEQDHQQVSEPKGAQLERGYVRTANEIVEAFAKAPLTSRESRIIRAIERATFGWQRSTARLSQDVLSKMTGLTPKRCSEAVNSLLRKRVIIREGGSQSPIGINTKVSEWDFSAQKARTSPKWHNNPKWGQSPQDGDEKRPQDGYTNKERKDINPLTTFEGGAYEAKPAPKPKAKPKGYPESFEACWQEYPKREGSNPKNRAFTGWKARLKEGVTEDEMLAGTKRYAAFIRAKGDENTAFVMQAQRFFGTAREFENAWGKPAPKPNRNEPPNPYASMGDCEGRVYIPGKPSDSAEWRARK